MNFPTCNCQCFHWPHQNSSLQIWSKKSWSRWKRHCKACWPHRARIAAFTKLSLCNCATSREEVALWWSDTAVWPACVGWFGAGNISILHGKGVVIPILHKVIFPKLWSRGDVAPTVSLHCFLFKWVATLTAVRHCGPACFAKCNNSRELRSVWRFQTAPSWDDPPPPCSLWWPQGLSHVPMS